jgi:uncharacterized peroxidase-related enzyme
MSWIQVIEKDEASEKLKEIYNEISDKRGKLSNIMKVQSLNPDAMKKHMEIYLTLMFGSSNLSREDRELIAVVVSSLNNCDYCVNHHAKALNHYWKDDKKIQSLIENYKSIDISEKKRNMLDYVDKLTKKPMEVKKTDLDILKDSGYSDEDILNINLITCYFNFVNRIALGLGVELSYDEISGYKY